MSGLPAGAQEPAIQRSDRSNWRPFKPAKQVFEIPAGDLGTALQAWALISQVKLLASTDAIRELQTAGVSGPLTSEEALRHLLTGSGLAYAVTGVRSITVYEPRAALSARAQAMQLPGIDAVGTGASRGEASEDYGTNRIEIGAKELERKNPQDIKDVFVGEPGVQVGSSLPMSQKVYVHGVEETNLAVTIDGSLQTNKIFHHSGTNLIDPSLLKAVRVDAGVAPADAGPGALAGAIAYETKSARDLLEGRPFGGFLKSSFNTNGNTTLTNLAGYGQRNGWEALAAFTLGKGSEFTAGTGETVAGTATNIVSGLGKLAYEAHSGDRIEISHERVTDDAPRPFRANIGFLTGRPAWEPRVRDYRLVRQNTVLTYSDSTPEGWWNPKAVLAYSTSQIQTPIFAAPPAAVIPGTGESGNFNGKFENRFPLSFGNVTSGIDFYNSQSKYFDRTFFAAEHASNVGVYTQARLTPTERTRLSFGARADQQKFEGTAARAWTNAGISGNLSGEYDLVRNFLTAKAGYSRVWAGIPLAENFIMNPLWDYRSGPEVVTSENTTLGLVAQHMGFTVEGSVFRTAINNARMPVFRAVGPLGIGAIRAFDLYTEGYELGAGYNWGPGFVRVKYANVDVKINGLPTDSDTGTYLATPVGKIVTITSAHTFQTGVTIGGDVQIVLPYASEQPGLLPLPGYEVVNTFVEYQPPSWPNLTFRVDVKNLLNEAYADRATYGQEFNNVRPLYEPGRSFILTAKAKF